MCIEFPVINNNCFIDVIFRERSQSQREHTAWFHLHEVQDQQSSPLVMEVRPVATSEVGWASAGRGQEGTSWGDMDGVCTSVNVH